jgi:hypothetical protein
LNILTILNALAPIIEAYRKTDFGPEALRNFEVLAEGLICRKKQVEAGARERLERVVGEHGIIP